MGITCPGQVLACLSYQKIRGERFFSLYFGEGLKICLTFLAFVEIIWLLGLFLKPFENKLFRTRRLLGRRKRFDFKIK